MALNRENLNSWNDNFDSFIKNFSRNEGVSSRNCDLTLVSFCVLIPAFYLLNFQPKLLVDIESQQVKMLATFRSFTR